MADVKIIDSDYAGASLDRKSTTRGCQFLGSSLISWQCKKQIVVANSTTEAEYIAASHCCGQVLWIQNQMLDYGYNLMQTKIHVDNESAICVVKNPGRLMVYKNSGLYTSTNWIEVGSVERAITTDASLDAAHASDNIFKTQSTTMLNVDIPQGIDTGGSPKHKETIGGTPAQTRSERVLEQPNEPPLSKGHTSRSGEGRMEQTFKLTDNVPSTLHDSPLLVGYTPRSDKGRLQLQELMIVYKIVKTVHTLFIDGIPMKIHMLVEKKYPLIKELLKKMLNLQSEAEEESTMLFELIKFIKSMLEE
ncbi:hypothetical protein Tco_0328152 [Tanacetum coccineum]